MLIVIWVAARHIHQIFTAAAYCLRPKSYRCATLYCVERIEHLCNTLVYRVNHIDSMTRYYILYMYYIYHGKEGVMEPPEHHLSDWKPVLTVHDAASAPIKLPPFSDYVCSHSSSASPGLSVWLSASAASASLM
jgi:hypothetical protein